MANTNLDLLYPEFWAASFDKLDVGKYGLQNMVSRNQQGLIARSGDSVNVPLTPDLGDADDWTPGSTITASDIAQESATISLDQSKKKTITLNGTELSLSPYDLINSYGVPMAKTILKAVNLSIYQELMKTDQYVDGLTTFNEDSIIDAGTNLSSLEIGDENRQFCMGVDDYGVLQKLDAFQFANYSGTNAMQTGVLGQKFGFDISTNNIISTYTPADVAGAVNLVAGYVSGDSTMIVDGFDDDTNPIRVGDIFVVAGNTGYLTVTSTTTTSSDTTGITFTPDLSATVADNAAITVTPSRSALAFVPSAVAFAARAYAPLPIKDIMTTIENVNGLPVRISTWHNGNLGINVQFDILYGVEMINSNRVTKVLTD